MSLSKSTHLLEFILEKEKQERKKRNKRMMMIGAGVAIAGFTALGSVLFSSNSAIQNSMVYPIADLNSVEVEKLLSQAPSGLKVSDHKSGDTFLLRDVHQFAMLRAALMDDSQPIASTADWEAGNVGTTEVEGITSEISSERRKEIKRMIASEGPLTEADIMPAFPGGQVALKRFLSKQLRYPIEASRNKTQGTVYLRFVIDEEGMVNDPEVMRGIGDGCDEEAIRVLQQMPPWLAGEVSGVKVPVYATLAINFRFL